MKSKFEQLRDMLTQKEWENFLANQYRRESHFDNEALDQIILGSFNWEKSPQGHDYWAAIRERVRDNLPVPETLQTVLESPTKSRTHILEELVVACQQWADNPTFENAQRIREVLANLENA